MCRERQEETISELLANEVRLREKREKKRVKRQLKRQQRQIDDLSDSLEVLHEEDALSVSTEDDMSCDELDWDQRHFSDVQGRTNKEELEHRKGHLIVLGLQADGTELAIKVYKNDECPVKCGILNQLVQPLKLDYNFLIQYRTFTVSKDFAFLSMNICECNVRQYIEWKLQQNSFDANIASGLVWHMLKGLKSLHDNNILHGRLKPENLLIDSKGRLLLANYGFHHLCKHQTWSSSNGQKDNEKSEDEKCWQPSEILRSEQHKKYTSKSDIQVAGMVAHFIISGGHHPFGQDDEVILNIILNDWQLHHLSEEASDIISAMLSGAPTNRPDVEDIMKHPYFWSTGRRFELLLNAGSHLALMSSSVFGLSEEAQKNLLELIKILDSDNQFQEWKTLIDNSFIEELKIFFQYQNTLTGLILFIYNTWNRWNQTCKERRHLLPEPSSYFFHKFPKLFCAVYHHIKTSSLRNIIPYQSYY
ncbi:unnamed protein product [Acanthosepion pharaonis]|uniref:Protein kinase domain-containing protein n=1 Tax=Acanthosepion pharaonis TaxID=158019 RepID=A0A812BGS0_ACAPH|nr:unnamed protein product [Sepia pharaonis]